MDRVAKVNMLFSYAEDDEILLALQRNFPDEVSKYRRKNPRASSEAGQAGFEEPPRQQKGTKEGPILVACFYAPKDRSWYGQLHSHLSASVRSDVIRLW